VVRIGLLPLPNAVKPTANAAQLGANAIIGFGYDTTEIAQGMTEELAYGTAVIVEPENGPA